MNYHLCRKKEVIKNLSCLNERVLFMTKIVILPCFCDFFFQQVKFLKIYCQQDTGLKHGVSKF